MKEIIVSCCHKKKTILHIYIVASSLRESTVAFVPLICLQNRACCLPVKAELAAIWRCLECICIIYLVVHAVFYVDDGHLKGDWSYSFWIPALLQSEEVAETPPTLTPPLCTSGVSRGRRPVLNGNWFGWQALPRPPAAADTWLSCHLCFIAVSQHGGGDSGGGLTVVEGGVKLNRLLAVSRVSLEVRRRAGADDSPLLCAAPMTQSSPSSHPSQECFRAPPRFEFPLKLGKKVNCYKTALRCSELSFLW